MCCDVLAQLHEPKTKRPYIPRFGVHNVSDIGMEEKNDAVAKDILEKSHTNVYIKIWGEVKQTIDA